MSSERPPSSAVASESHRPVRKGLGGLHVLADDDPRWPRDPIALARAACAGGAVAVQLRAKHATDREVLRLAASIRAITRRSGTLFFVNDRFDLALTAGADGVHLGQDDLPPERIPGRLRQRLLVGRSTHDPEQIQQARREGVDYVAFGPVFGTTTKDSIYPARGVESVAEAVRLARPLPLIAIGGIDVVGARALRAAGAAGVAVISTVAGAEDPEAATQALVEALRAGGEP